ncbi:MAG: hypothetical protein JOZ41_22385 [Chloroflexi bacterium]|nr:hypothetical protein [Chloroflexota bacterium]
MIRAALYIVAAAAIWLGEGFMFSRLLGFEAWQVALMAVLYLALFAAALALLLRFAQASLDAEGGLPRWRYLSMAPALVVVVGSFVSLPLLLLILALGRLA